MKKENPETIFSPQGKAIDREGFALVTTLLMVLVLSVLAVGVVWMASSEKKTAFAEQNHITSLFSADAGGEAGINFVRLAPRPPLVIDWADSSVSYQAGVNLHDSQNYGYNCLWRSTSAPPLGWDMDYKNFNYRINSNGSAATKGKSNVRMSIARLYREGY